MTYYLMSSAELVRRFKIVSSDLLAFKEDSDLLASERALGIADSLYVLEQLTAEMKSRGMRVP